MQPGAALVCDNWVPTLQRRQIARRLSAVVHAARTECRLSPGLSTCPAACSACTSVRQIHCLTSPRSCRPWSRADSRVGNYAAAQFANQGGDWLIVVNEAGDAPLRFNGSTWDVLDPTLPTPPENLITGPPDSPIENGKGLTYVWKYRNRLFFIEGGTMNAWYLGINSIGGALQMIPLSGAARMGGQLISGAVMSIDAGDGMDDKMCIPHRSWRGDCLYRHRSGQSQ